jgi:uncharacterized protein
VLVSAAIAEGPPGRVIERAIAGEFRLIVPDLVREELIRALAQKLGWEAMELATLDAEVLALAIELPVAPGAAPAITGDPTDDRILAAATGASADVLVTGDRRHLVPVGTHQGLRIVLPQALLAELHTAT